MSASQKIGLVPAILINVNTIIGAGLFVNTNVLAQLAGAWGFASYLLGALILLPIALSIASLASQHPVAGGLYTYSKTYLGQNAGFLSGWCYFLGKATSGALLTHTFTKFLVVRVAALQEVNILILDAVVLTLLMGMHSVGISIGGRVQYLFTALKGIPILAVICLSLFLFDSSVYAEPLSLVSLFDSLTIVAFAFSSFEIICSITHLLDHAAERAKVVVMTSFAIVTVIYTLFQLSIVGALDVSASAAAEPVRQLFATAFPNMPQLSIFINSLVFTSILGGAYSILGSNCWNLFTLAKEQLIPGHRLLTRVNRNGIPLVSMVIQGALALSVLAISSDQISLQNMFVLCVCTSYLLSSIAATQASKNRFEALRSFIAVGSCLYLIRLASQRLAISGVSTPFLGVFLLGIVLALYQKVRKSSLFC